MIHCGKKCDQHDQPRTDLSLPNEESSKSSRKKKEPCKPELGVAQIDELIKQMGRDRHPHELADRKSSVDLALDRIVGAHHVERSRKNVRSPRIYQCGQAA